MSVKRLKDDSERTKSHFKEEETSEVEDILSDMNFSGDKSQDQRSGWNNLIAIVACLSISKQVISNYAEFGLLMNIPLAGITLSDTFWLLIHVFLNVARCVLVFPLKRFTLLSFLIIFISESLLSVLVLLKISYLYLSGWAHILSILGSLKLISFVVERPNCMFHDFTKFLIAPTLVFQSKFRKRTNISFNRIFSVLIKCCVYFLLFIFVMDQLAVPSLYRVVHSHSYINILENAINLSISTIFMFNLFFQMIFNCLVPILNEISCFDEVPYSSWWNSRSAGDFWVKWNIPVHRFIKRYVYAPQLRYGVRSAIARTVCFIFSGLLHEIVISLALKQLNGFLFLAMVGQIPLIYLSDYVKRVFPKLSNIFFWLSFCVIGQPLIALLIYRSLHVIPTHSNKSMSSL